MSVKFTTTVLLPEIIPDTEEGLHIFLSLLTYYNNDFMVLLFIFYKIVLRKCVKCKTIKVIKLKDF